MAMSPLSVDVVLKKNMRSDLSMLHFNDFNVSTSFE